MPYGDLEKVLDTFLDLQKNLGKSVHIYFKDGRKVEGKLSSKIEDFYLRWPNIRVTVENAMVKYGGEEKKYQAIRLILNPLLGNFEYEFFDKG